MSDLVGNPEDRFSQNEAHITATNIYKLQHCAFQKVKAFSDRSNAFVACSLLWFVLFWGFLFFFPFFCIALSLYRENSFMYPI